MAWRPPPPLIALGCLAAAYAAHALVPTPRLAPAPWNLLGLGLVAAGFALAARGARAFRARGANVHPWRRPTAFVAEGPYRRTRNPMYLGLLAAVLGVAVMVGSAAMLLAPALFLLAMDRWVIPWEERELEAAFGDTYAAYKRRVRRWL